MGQLHDDVLLEEERGYIDFEGDRRAAIWKLVTCRPPDACRLVVESSSGNPLMLLQEFEATQW